MTPSRALLLAFSCAVFALGLSSVLYLAKIRSLSETIRYMQEDERFFLTRAPQYVEGRILSFDASTSSLIFENLAERYRNASPPVRVKIDERTRLLRRDAVLENDIIIIGTRQAEVTSPREIPEGTLAVAHVKNGGGILYATEIIFGTFPR